MNDARTPVSEVIERLNAEIAGLSREVDKAFGDSVYMPMSATEQQVHDKKLAELKRLRQELAQLIQLQKQSSESQNGTIIPPAGAPNPLRSNTVKSPKDVT